MHRGKRLLTVEEIGQFGAFGKTSVEAQVSVLDASWCKEPGGGGSGTPGWCDRPQGGSATLVP